MNAVRVRLVAVPDLESPAVEQLAAALRDGSRDALGTMYAAWSPLVHTFALRALGNHHDAEDVTQQVFIAAWRSRHTVRPSPSVFPGWLIGIAKNKVADARTARYRSHRNTAAVAALTVEERVTAPDTALADRLLVDHELDRLGEPRGTVVRMALIEDRPHEEISRHLDIPLGTVKSHVRRGLITLRSRMEEVDHVAS